MTSVSVPAGCAVTFKVWGAGGGGTNSRFNANPGGGGGGTPNNLGLNATGNGGGYSSRVGQDAGSTSALAFSGGGGGGGGYTGGLSGAFGDPGTPGSGGANFATAGGTTAAGSGVAAGNNVDLQYSAGAGAGTDGNPGEIYYSY